MKSVGIVTFHCADNYGALLQAYALSEKLKQLELHPEFINFTPNRIRSPYEHSTNVIKNIKKHGIRLGIKKQLSNMANYELNRERKNNFNYFRDNYLNISSYMFSDTKELSNNYLKYDYYITGSDQVWNPEMIDGLEDVYFLNFGSEKTKRISYAASIAKELDKSKYELYSRYLKHLDIISIREDSHKGLVENLSGKSVEIVVDPTLLHDKDFWEDKFKLKIDSKRYVLVYDLLKDPLTIDTANYISKKSNVEIVSYSSKKNYIHWKESFNGKSPVKLLELIKNSECVVTSSFHGMIFAIIFNKPFYVISHPTRGSRMIDLLEKLGLEDRLVSTMIDIDLTKKIDYDVVNNKVMSMSKIAEEFLVKALDLGNE